MKEKKVLIVFKDKFGGSVGVVEKLFKTLISNLEVEGKRLKYVNNNMAVFEDGSTVSKVSIINPNSLRAKMVTHLYIDKNVLDIANADKIFRSTLEHIVISKGDYIHLEVDDDKHDRMFVFDNNLELKKYEEYI